jgi:drug/metabolite transporter (DMT)-like permease
MRAADVARLVALAILWSLSFIFIRVLVPTLGPVWVATSRLLVAGVALTAAYALARRHGDVARHWRAYLLMGVLNSALPFLLFAYAALTLPASYLVILNAMLPLFGAVAASLWLSEPLDAARVAGLVSGTMGVVLVSGAGPIVPSGPFVLAVAASLGAVACYALAGVWLKRRGAAAPPATAMAGWSQLMGGLVMVPLAAATPPPGPITAWVVVNALLLALLCSAIAYVLYFRLIADVGPTRAMTVTFLMPAFGLLWSRALLGEAVTLPMLVGAALVVAGTAAVLQPRRARR